MRSKAQFEIWYRAICKDIYVFCRLLNFEPTPQQRELFDAFKAGHRSIAVRSGQGPGKTTASAVLGMYRLITRPEAKLIVTAPTMGQCKDVWLAECERLLSGADKFLASFFTITNTTIGIARQKAKLWGALMKTSDKSESAQGQHAKNMDVICEEASGVAREIIEQYEGTLSNRDALFLQIGNPNTRNCAFFDCFQDPVWKCLCWNAEETPASAWFDPERNKKLEKKYGRESNVYRVRVLGEFPKIDDDCVFSEEEVRACTDPSTKLPMARLADKHTGQSIKQIGGDFARYGGDENCVVSRQGLAMLDLKFRSHSEPSTVFNWARVIQHDRHWKDDDTVHCVDASGIGQGILHRYYDADLDVYEFHNHGTPYDSEEFHDQITEAWFYVRDLVKAKSIYIMDDPLLIKQLCTRQYSTNNTGKIQLESKEKYRKRKENEGASPDRADAFVMAFYPYAKACGLSARAG